MRRIKSIILATLIFSMLLWGQAYVYKGALISTAQDFTTAWADLGGEIDCTDYRLLILFIEIDRNDGANLKITALSKHTSAGTNEYWDAIYRITGSVVYAEPDYMEFNVDEDKKYKLKYLVDKATPYIQIQIKAGTVGASKAQIDSCTYALAR